MVGKCSFVPYFNRLRGNFASMAVASGAPRIGSLVLVQRSVADGQERRSLTEIRGIHIDFAKSQPGTFLNSDQEIRFDDIEVRGIARDRYPLSLLLSPGTEYWTNAVVEGDRVIGGERCFLLTHGIEALTINLILRRAIDGK